MRIDDKGDSYVSTQSYAPVLRCLYDTCYNIPKYSQEIIDLLSRTDFRAPSRLLPRGMKVAHKIGTANKDGFNDCGIVYAPKKPFIFCAMLTQPDADHASEDIAQIVRQAYDQLNK